jgi:hypothetical protein
MRVILFESSFCVLDKYHEKLFKCVYYRKNKAPSFTHIGCFKIAKIYVELLKYAHHFLLHDFLYFSVTPMNLCF